MKAEASRIVVVRHQTVNVANSGISFMNSEPRLNTG